MQRVQRAQRAEPQNHFELLPGELVRLIWRFQASDAHFYRRASLVCRFWRAQTSQAASECFNHYFPDLYPKLRDRACHGSVDWAAELKYAMMKYCSHFTPSELEDYRAFRAGDWQKIEEILRDRHPLKRIFLFDNQNRFGLHYFASATSSSTRQRVFDAVFAVLSARFKVESQSWSMEHFTEELKKEWKGLIVDFRVGDNIPAILLLAVACNQTEIIKSLLPIPLKSHLWMDRLLSLALMFNHESAFMALLNFNPTAFFMIDEFHRHRCMDQHFATTLFGWLKTQDLKKDRSRRQLLHWAFILNQVDYIATAKDVTILMNQQFFIRYLQTDVFHPFATAQLREVHCYLPIQFACVWGVDLYRQALSKGASPSLSSNLLDIPVRCGDPQLLDELFQSDYHLTADAATRKRHATRALTHAFQFGELDCVKVIFKHEPLLAITLEMVTLLFGYNQYHVIDYLCSQKKIELTQAELDFLYNDVYDFRKLKMLLRLGLGLNAEDASCCVPLHLFAKDFQYDHSMVLKGLLRDGAYVDFTNRENKTPLESLVDALEHSVPANALQHILVLVKAGANLCREGVESVFDRLKSKISDSKEYEKIEAAIRSEMPHREGFEYLSLVRVGNL